MTYPLDSLTVLTPIVFFVLLFAFPVIGVFAGWKRAAYWGGGNLLFYIIGLIVWRTAGPSICATFIPMLKSMLGGDYNVDTLVYSVISPAFFIILMLVANIILVICYYAFAKRLIGIGKYDKFKHPENFKKEDKDFVRTTKSVPGKKQVHVANTRWFNMVVGGVGLTALMLPITLTTTHAVAMTTTSVDTRKTNSLTSALYNGLQDTSGNFSWFSFYTGKNAGNDYNFLFSALATTQKTIQVGEKTYTGTEAFTEALPNEAKDLANTINDLGTISSENISNVESACNKFTDALNEIIGGLGADNLGALVNSNGGQDLMADLIPSGMVEIKSDTLSTQLNDQNSILNKFKDACAHEQDGKYVTEIEGVGTLTIDAVQEAIPVSQESYDKLLDTTTQMFKVEEGTEVTEELKSQMREVSDLLLKMIFEVK